MLFFFYILISWTCSIYKSPIAAVQSCMCVFIPLRNMCDFYIISGGGGGGVNVKRTRIAETENMSLTLKSYNSDDLEIKQTVSNYNDLLFQYQIILNS